VRRIAIFSATLLLLPALATPAQAEMVEDCEQDHDPDLRISGCTAVIGSGQWQGKELAWAYYSRGVAYDALGENRRAIEDFTQVLRLDPGDAEAYYDRGNSYRIVGDYARAIEDYDQALRLEPGDAETYNNRAWTLYLVGRNAEALRDVDRSLSLVPERESHIDTRAHVLAAMGRQSEALAEFERAMEAGGADQVRSYQEALVKHGYYRGAVDGVYGPQVRAALVACLRAGCRLLDGGINLSVLGHGQMNSREGAQLGFIKLFAAT
jgi:tetratricopeptide (TPR) repeat protein